MRLFVAARNSLIVGCLCLVTTAAQADPEQTVRSADQILHEVMVIPARQIPESLLAEAQGVVIIPDVIKIGFVAGIRRGHGVVMVRDSEGEWSLPQFITLTGGSVGWQAGLQGTDVVLVFMTKRSVDGLLRGKFTVGVDAAAAAGPVGRNAAAATDARLKAEILSYSRSRGLFIGLSLDGSAIETDTAAQVAFYGAPPLQVPLRIPESAVKLRQDLALLTPGGKAEPGLTEVPTPAGTPSRLSIVRRSLGTSASQLYGVLDDPWRKYLAIPKEVFEGNDTPRMEALQASLQQFDQVAQSPKYKNLAQQPEFQTTHELLREYISELSATRNQLSLPPPPSHRGNGSP